MTDAELFSRRIADHAESAMRNSVEYTGFLSEDEQEALDMALNSNKK